MEEFHMYKLLIADDEVEILNGLCNYFPWEECGFELAAQATNGEEVIQLLLHQKFDAILCDINMPHKSGLEIAAFVKNHYPSTKIVLLSGHKEFDYAQQAIHSKVYRYLLKPTQYDELFQTFSEIAKELNTQAMTLPSIPYDELYDLSSNTNKTIHLIVQYINGHYGEASLYNVAHYLNMNPSYLSTYFKAKTNISFSDYLSHIRMKYAAYLLLETNTKIYAISDLVGYTNPKNFTRKFTSYFGMSPKDYRNTVHAK